MKDTCDPANCSFLKKVLKEETPEGCPNYIESWWTKVGEEQPILVKDCAPKRMVLMCQEVVNANLRLQQANEQMRNESHRIISNFDLLVQKAAERAALEREAYIQLEGGRQ